MPVTRRPAAAPRPVLGIRRDSSSEYPVTAQVTAGRPLFSKAHAAFLAARYPGLEVAAAPPPDWYGEMDEAEEDESDDDISDPEPEVAAPAPAAPARQPMAATNKRPKLRPAPTAAAAAAAPAAPPPPPSPSDLHHGPSRTLALYATAPDGKRTLLANVTATFALCPDELEATPDGYDKDLDKVQSCPIFPARVEGDANALAGFLAYLVARKKAAVLSRGPPRVYLEPQTLGPQGAVVFRYRES